ncbi:unnamed protein product [Diamesa hyperborea]
MVMNGAKVVVAVVLVMCIANVTAQTTNACANVTSGFRNDYTECRNYFSCVQGFEFPQQCANGLHFNVATSRCDLEANARCVPCPATGRLIYRMAGSCRGYVRCNNGNAVRLECDLGLWFNPINQVCERRATVTCPHRHDCPINGDHYIRAEGDLTCLRYQFCSNGLMEGIYSCARDLFFNVALGRCVASARCPQV